MHKAIEVLTIKSLERMRALNLPDINGFEPLLSFDSDEHLKDPIVREYMDAIKILQGHITEEQSAPHPPADTISKLPPVGVKPLWRHNEERFNDLSSAILQYVLSGKEVPAEWVNEAQSLRAYLEGRKKQRGG